MRPWPVRVFLELESPGFLHGRQAVGAAAPGDEATEFIGGDIFDLGGAQDLEGQVILPGGEILLQEQAQAERAGSLDLLQEVQVGQIGIFAKRVFQQGDGGDDVAAAQGRAVGEAGPFFQRERDLPGTAAAGKALDQFRSDIPLAVETKQGLVDLVRHRLRGLAGGVYRVEGAGKVEAGDAQGLFFRGAEKERQKKKKTQAAPEAKQAGQLRRPGGCAGDGKGIYFTRRTSAISGTSCFITCST